MTDLHTTAPVGDDTHELFTELAELRPNFGVEDGPFTVEHGWKVDDHCCPLPDEVPGPPEPDGPFAAARDVLHDYAMADPGIIRAVYDPGAPLLGRTMALEGRFTFLRFPMGVRVTDVVDDVTEVDGRRVARWGWGYSTLEGHLEQGRMDWEVWKWLDAGDVEFRIHAFSKRGRIDNPIIRLGFAVFGRWMQERFYDAVQARMRHLVERRTGRTTKRAYCHTATERPLLGELMGSRPARP